MTFNNEAARARLDLDLGHFTSNPLRRNFGACLQSDSFDIRIDYLEGAIV